jgi:5,10-methylenetetrahydromethanopterin reductase
MADELSTRTFTIGVGLWQGSSLARLAELGREIEDAGYDHVWYANHKLYRDMFVGLSVLGGSTSRIGVGTFVAEPYSQHPAQLAAGIATIAELTDGRATLVLGSGGGSLKWLGLKRQRSLTALRESVTIARRLLAGETVDHDGELFSTRGAHRHVPVPRRVPVVIAARSDKMLELAGTVADGAMVATYATPDGLGHARALVAKGLEASGRPLDGFPLYARVDVAVDDDEERAMAAVKPIIAMMVMASYPKTDFLDHVGLSLTPELEEMCRRRDEALALASGQLVPDSYVEKYAWVGSPARVALGIAAAVRSGFQNIVLLPQPLDADPAEAIQRIAKDVLPLVEQELGSGSSQGGMHEG